MPKHSDSTQTTERAKPDRTPRKARPDQVLLSGQQAEQIYGIPYRSIYDLHLRNVLPAVRFDGGKRLWFRRADLDLLIANSQVRCS